MNSKGYRDVGSIPARDNSICKSLVEERCRKKNRIFKELREGHCR